VKIITTTKSRLIRIIKLPFKLLHQVIALSKNFKIIKNVSIRRVTHSWPDGNVLGLPSDVHFQGIVIAKVWVPPENILVTNDIPQDLGNLPKTERNIPFKESKRLAVSRIRSRELDAANKFDEETREYLKRFDVSFAKVDYFIQNARVHKFEGGLSCNVIVKLSGDVVIIDGIHRAIASYLINDNLEFLEMFVVLQT
jgi:hypothetical protein